MELTIEQALQQAVTAHKEGKLQDAERLYRAILQSQPTHPDANHNLGLIAVSVNKADAALPLFKTALKANPKIQQFWISYIDALIKTEKFGNASQALADAKQAGIAVDKLKVFEEQLQSEQSPSSDIPQQEFGNQLQNDQGQLSAAIKLREIGKYKEAQEWLSNVIENDPRNAEALSLLSQVLLLDKKEAEAERVLTEAALINSELPSVCRNKARLLLKQSKTAEALDQAQLGCKKSPGDSESLLVLAACLGANQRDSEALSIIEKILESESKYAEAYAHRALIKLRAKDAAGAIEDAEMTVSLKPHLIQMWLLLGSLQYQNSNLIGAIEALKKANKNEPKNTTLMIQLGDFLRQDNKAREAITILQQATELAPKEINAWTTLGAALQHEKKLADAKIAYEKALALDSKSAAILSNLGALAIDARELESAVNYFEKALQIEPNLSEVHANLGIVLTELGKLDEAEASYTQAIALKPNFADAHYNLGIILKERGRFGEAEASYKQAIALKPNYAEAHNNLGNTLQELGREDEAKESFTHAIALKPNYADAHYNLGNSLRELGRLEESKESYKKAIALKPDYFLAHDHLGAILQKEEKFDEAEVCFKNWSSLKPERIAKTVSRGSLLFSEGKFEQALEAFESYNDPMSKAQILESLWALGRVDDIYSRLEAEAGLSDENIRIAAIAAFLAEREKKDTAHNFCNNPMEFLHFGNISSKMEDYSSFNASVIDEIQNTKTEWELHSARNGFHGSVNIFNNPLPNISILNKLILDEIDIYYSKFKDKTCAFIKKWPSKNIIEGWHAVLKKQGYHTPHIHVTGWLSGVVYLKVVPALGKNEGAIEFSLNGPNYHDKNSPNSTFQPKLGDIVLFPSSLHHRTIPFSTDTERIMVAFDLQPTTARIT